MDRRQGAGYSHAMKIYQLADESVYEVLKTACDTYHTKLAKLNVRFGVIMVSSVDKDGEPDGKPALKSSSGHPAAAKVGLVSAKDKLSKNYDVEILIDLTVWGEMDDKKRFAVLDHEMTHVEIVEDKDGHAKIDDNGAPKLKLIPDQFHLWGFLEIAQRHGLSSSEVLCMRDMVEEHGHLFGVAPAAAPIPHDVMSGKKQDPQESFDLD